MKKPSGVVRFQGKEHITPALLAVSDGGLPRKPSTSRIVHPCWVLDYVFHEQGEYSVGSQGTSWKPRKACTAHLYAPSTVYWEKVLSIKKPESPLWITFSGGEAAGLGRLVSRKSFAEFEDREKKLGGILQHMVFAGGQNDFWKAQSFFCSAIRLLLNSHPLSQELFSVRTEEHKETVSPLCQTVREYLQNHVDKGVRLSELARHAKVSVSQLCHRYRKESGEAPMETLMTMRIEKVKAMLLKGERLKAIAEATGFTDEFHLSKMFKRKEGLSPRRYLQNLST